MPANRNRSATTSRLWMYTGLAMALLRFARRFLHDDEEVLYRTVVRAGDTFEIFSRKPTRK